MRKTTVVATHQLIKGHLMNTQEIDALHNKAYTWADLITDIEYWLESYQGGWSHQSRLDCEIAENGADRELDFDLEAYYENAYDKWLTIHNS